MDNSAQLRVTSDMWRDPSAIRAAFDLTPVTSHPMLSLWCAVAGEFFLVDADTAWLWKLDAYDLVFVLRQLTTKAHMCDLLRLLRGQVNDLIVVKHTQKRDQEANISLRTIGVSSLNALMVCWQKVFHQSCHLLLVPALPELSFVNKPVHRRGLNYSRSHHDLVKKELLDFNVFMSLIIPTRYHAPEVFFTVFLHVIFMRWLMQTISVHKIIRNDVVIGYAVA